MRPWVLFAVVFAAGIAVSAHSAAAGPNSATADSVPAPGFALPTRTGTVALDSLRGKVVLVDFWASWCEPCRRSFPWLASLHQRYSQHGLEIVAINLDKNRPAAEAFLRKFPAPFVVAFDPAGATAEAFRVSAMPSSYLIGPTGNILFSHEGFTPQDTSGIEARIKEACHP
jgi:cytochrome c biogenesis protein CcmG, thiol:disulfide interchange protein DsbE